jgi:hypothetical protein
LAKPSKSVNLSKMFLMGVAVSVIPLAGCSPVALEGGAGTQEPVETSASVTAEEAALFERARSLGTVAAAEQFLRAYPNSELVRSLLMRLPRTTLRGIDDSLVEKLSPSMINSLPFSVKQALGVEAGRENDSDQSGSGSGSRSGSSDGYSG